MNPKPRQGLSFEERRALARLSRVALERALAAAEESPCSPLRVARMGYDLAIAYTEDYSGSRPERLAQALQACAKAQAEMAESLTDAATRELSAQICLFEAEVHIQRTEQASTVRWAAANQSLSRARATMEEGGEKSLQTRLAQLQNQVDTMQERGVARLLSEEALRLQVRCADYTDEEEWSEAAAAAWSFVNFIRAFGDHYSTDSADALHRAARASWRAGDVQRAAFAFATSLAICALPRKGDALRARLGPTVALDYERFLREQGVASQQAKQFVDNQNRAFAIGMGLMRKGQAQFGREEYAEAVRTLSDSLQALPLEVQAMVLKARAHLRLGDRKSADRELERAFATWPMSPDALALRGHLRVNDGQSKLGIADLQAAVRQTRHPRQKRLYEILLEAARSGSLPPP